MNVLLNKSSYPQHSKTLAIFYWLLPAFFFIIYHLLLKVIFEMTDIFLN